MIAEIINETSEIWGVEHKCIMMTVMMMMMTTTTTSTTTKIG